MKKVTAKLIRLLNPCCDPSVLDDFEGLELTPIEFIDQFKDKVKYKKDIILVLCHKFFMTEKDLRLYAVWNAREALKLVENPDQRSVNACNVAERYAMGDATEEELINADTDAYVAYADVDINHAYTAVVEATYLHAGTDYAAYAFSATTYAAYAYAAYAADAYTAFVELQIKKLRTYF